MNQKKGQDQGYDFFWPVYYEIKDVDFSDNNVKAVDCARLFIEDLEKAAEKEDEDTIEDLTEKLLKFRRTLSRKSF